MGQWLEQEMAKRFGGSGQGAVAGLDIIFPGTFLSRVLYGDNHSFNLWGGRNLGLRMFEDQNGLTVETAIARGRQLADVALWRFDELGDYVDAPLRERERALLSQMSVPSPWDQFLTYGVREIEGDTIVFGCSDSHFGGLLPRVLASMAASTNVSVWSVLPENLAVAPGANPFEQWMEASRASQVLWHATLGAPTVIQSSVDNGLALPAISVHATVGPARQVEVARDVLLDALARGVAPHEIRVVTLDPTTFVPLIRAIWQDPSGGIPVQVEIADPTVPRESERLDALDTLMTTFDSHYTLLDFLRLIGEPAISRQLGLSGSEVERLMNLALDQGLSLGLSGEQRQNLGLYPKGDDEGTWQRFVDRLMLSTIFESHAESPEAPLWPLGEEGDGHSAAVVSWLIHRLLAMTSGLGQRATLAQWLTVVRGWTELIGRRPETIDNGIERVLNDLEADAAVTSATFSFQDFRTLFRETMTGLGGGSTMGRGGVIVQDPSSLSSTPFAVTCILGFDDENLPAEESQQHLGKRRPGDPSSRDRFRTNLLRLVGSTSQRVAIVHSDRDLKTNKFVESPIPLLEFRDLYGAAGGVVETRRHPRHPFSTEFAPTSEDVPPVVADVGFGRDDAFTFDPGAAVLAQRTSGSLDRALEGDVPTLASASPASVDALTLDTTKVAKFIKKPQETFLRGVFGGAYVADSETVATAVPRLGFAKGVELWAIRESLFRAASDGDGPIVVSRHHDAPLSVIAPGLRSFALAEVDTASLNILLSKFRENLDEVHATPRPDLRVACTIWDEELGCHVARPSTDVYDSDGGLLVVAASVSSSPATEFWPLVLNAAAMAVQTDQSVSGVVLLRPKMGDDGGSELPFVVLRWPSAATARAFLLNMQYFVQTQMKSLPYFAPRTAVALKSPELNNALFSKAKPLSAWEGGDFVPIPGEGQSPLLRLVLPFDLDDLERVNGGAFVTAAEDFSRCFAGLQLSTKDKATPRWVDAVMRTANV
jgi:hypothetical protein